MLMRILRALVRFLGPALTVAGLVAGAGQAALSPVAPGTPPHGPSPGQPAASEGTTASAAAGAAPASRVFHLYATDGYLTTADGRRLYIWGYSLENRPGSATVPGPRLEVEEGERVVIRLTNLGPSRPGGHPVPHTLHLHGLDVPQSEDGVPETSPTVGVGTTRTYTFTATHAGTYWYHCHVETVEHLTMGMYGALVVKARGGRNEAWTGGPSYDREYTLVLSEMDPDWSAAVAEGRPYDRTRFQPRYFFVNGRSFPDTMSDATTHLQGQLGQRLLIRLVNAGYQWRAMHLHGFHFQVIASDGRPLPQPLVKDTLSVGPGERYDLLVELNQLGQYPFHSHAVLDNTNDGRYPGGIHTMLTVTAEGPAGQVAVGASDQLRVPVQQGASGAQDAHAGHGDIPPQAPAGAEVAMQDDAFRPERLVVTAGTTVAWLNRDARTHNVVLPGITSPDLSRGQRWSYTFWQPGIYDYECAFHRGMEGRVVVRPAAGSGGS